MKVFMRRSILIALLSMALAGCEAKRSWTEEVALEDGSEITIERHVRFAESNSWSGDAYGATETQATLKFTGALKDLPVWDVPLMPMVLHRDTGGEWVLVATTTRCEVWHELGKPRPPYWEFHLTRDGWSERPLSESSLNRPANLFISYSGEVPRHVTIERKRAIASDRTIYEQYQRVEPAMPRGYCFG